mmetsp:Transcript_13290/g.21587  ORF Transcript_13290/g.21587 Transcript_13290/m.21587 type:complete len:254 (-) Transcript_13290:143-904(-)
MSPAALSSASMRPCPPVMRVRTHPGCSSAHSTPRGARSTDRDLLTMFSADLDARYAYPAPLPLSLTLPTLLVTLPTSAPPPPGRPMMPCLSSCWVTSSGPTVLIRNTCVISSEVMSSSAQLLNPSLPVVPALFITTSTTPLLSVTGAATSSDAAQLPMDASSSTSSAVSARRRGPTTACRAARSPACSTSRHAATTVFPSDCARSCLTNSRPIPRLAPAGRGGARDGARHSALHAPPTCHSSSALRRRFSYRV